MVQVASLLGSGRQAFVKAVEWGVFCTLVETFSLGALGLAFGVTACSVWYVSAVASSLERGQHF